MSSRNSPPTSAALVTLDEAVRPYSPAVSVRTLRALIAAGRLPVARVGRNLLVNPAELDELLTPRFHAPAPQYREPAAGLTRGEGGDLDGAISRRA